MLNLDCVLIGCSLVFFMALRSAFTCLSPLLSSSLTITTVCIRPSASSQGGVLSPLGDDDAMELLERVDEHGV